MGYEILDNRNNHDLEKGLFASLSALQFNQFGREVYSSVIQFKDLADFLEIFPSVQRDIIPRKVASIRRYILSADEDQLRFFSAITVTSRGHAFYDNTNKRLALDVANTKLSINDGQHRFEATKTALAYLEKEFLKAKSKEKVEKIRKQIDSLEKMAIPMVIFSGLSEEAEKQLFHDLNNLAQRPSRNTNIKLSQTDLFAKLSREIADYNRYLKHYGVEKEKSSIHDNNQNTVLLTTVYNAIKELFKYELRADKEYLNEKNYKKNFEYVNKWLDDVFFVLPPDLNTKGKYVLDKSYGLTSVFRFVAKMLNEGNSREFILDIINNSEFNVDSPVWSEYNGRINKFGRIEFTGGTGGGHRALYNMLMDKAQEKLNKQESFNL